MKPCLRILAGLIVFSFAHSAAAQETAREVIDRHIEAVGGREALTSIRSMVVEYGGYNISGKVVTIRRSWKRPYFFRQEVVGGTSARVTDGESVWLVDEDGWRKIDELDYLRIPDIDGDFIRYQDRGITFTYLGVETFGSSTFSHLKKTHKDGSESAYYFSTETDLLSMMSNETPIGTVRSVLWDYRRVAGVLIPHVMVVSEGPITGLHGTVYEEVRVNVPLPDSLFIEPRREADYIDEERETGS
jgi:outer membrane lipoprotein-sorting protein